MLSLDFLTGCECGSSLDLLIGRTKELKNIVEHVAMQRKIAVRERSAEDCEVGVT